jgi:hypothetical protein
MGEPHLDLLALPARLLERVRMGQPADVLTHLLIDIAGHFAHDCGRAPRLQGAGRAVILVGSVVDDVTLIDIAGAGQLCPAWADVDVARVIEDKVGSAEGPIRSRRPIPHRNMRRNLAIHQAP